MKSKWRFIGATQFFQQIHGNYHTSLHNVFFDDLIYQFSRRVYRYAARVKIFSHLVCFILVITIHRSRENLQNSSAFTYIIISVALPRVGKRAF